MAVGDICPGDKSIMGLGVLSRSRTKGVSVSFEKLDGIFDASDLVLGNFEGLLTRTTLNNRNPQLTFCGLPTFAQELADRGFNVLTVANNHALEHGPAIFLETVELLSGAGIHVCGLRDRVGDYYSAPVFVDRAGIKIGIIGYNWVINPDQGSADEHISQSHDSIVNYTWHRQSSSTTSGANVIGKFNRNVIQDLERLKKEADLVILMAHWGYEFVPYPPYGVTREAKSFIDAGADIVVGSHPHVLQGIEYYEDKPIIYSLGNFLFDMRDPWTRRTAVAEIEVSEDRETKCFFHPYIINGFLQPEPILGDEGEWIRAKIDLSSRQIAQATSDGLLNDDRLYKAYERYYNKAKLRHIVNHLLALAEDPLVLRIISRKIIGFVGNLMRRLKGEKVRW